MNGVKWNIDADSGLRLQEVGHPIPAARVLQPFVPSVWEGRAGFGGKNCVCTEARLTLPGISTSGGILAPRADR